MRILFKNLFEEATVLATNESLNYPVTNLIHPFLRKRFQSTTTTSLITATFTEDQTMDCFFYGFHNLTGLTAVYKDSGGGTLYTLVVSDIQDIGIEYFTALTTVRSVEITVTGASGFRLGGIAGGVCFQMPDPLAAYDPGAQDNSDASESPDGQTLQNFVRPLREFDFGFRDQTGDLYKAVRDEYFAVGIGKPLFMDLYEENRDKEEPIYAKLIDPLNFPYQARRHSFTIKAREAR